MICPSCHHDNIEGVDRCDNCMKPLRNLDVPRADAARGLVRSVMEDDLARLEQEVDLTAHPDDPAMDVIERMKQAGRGCVLVVDGGALVGIFTEREEKIIVNRVLRDDPSKGECSIFQSSLKADSMQAICTTDNP